MDTNLAQANPGHLRLANAEAFGQGRQLPSLRTQGAHLGNLSVGQSGACVGLAGPPPPAPALIPIAHVVRVGAIKEMTRITARAIVARVAAYLRPSPIGDEVRQPVRAVVPAPVEAHAIRLLPGSRGRLRALPLPATGLGDMDFGLEPREVVANDKSHVSHLSNTQGS